MTMSDQDKMDEDRADKMAEILEETARLIRLAQASRGEFDAVVTSTLLDAIRVMATYMALLDKRHALAKLEAKVLAATSPSL